MLNLVYFAGISGAALILLLIVVVIWLLSGRTVFGALVGLGTAFIAAVVAGPPLLMLFLAALFMANDEDHRQRNRPPEPLPQAEPYERPLTTPDRVSHRFRVKIVMRDAQGNRSEQVGNVTVTLVHDPRARDGIGDAHLWTATGEPLAFEFGSHRATTRWNAKALLDSCLSSRADPYRSYGALYEAAARLYGVCPNFDAAKFLVVDGKSSRGSWPDGVRVAQMMMTTTGAIASNETADTVPTDATVFVRP